MVTESSREQKRTLRIAESPKKVTRLKLGALLEAGKQRELEQINELVRDKLEDCPNTASRVLLAARRRASTPTRPSSTTTSPSGASTASPPAATSRAASTSSGPTTSPPSSRTTTITSDNSNPSGSHELVPQLYQPEVDRLQVAVQHMAQLRLQLLLQGRQPAACPQCGEALLQDQSLVVGIRQSLLFLKQELLSNGLQRTGLGELGGLVVLGLRGVAEWLDLPNGCPLQILSAFLQVVLEGGFPRGLGVVGQLLPLEGWIAVYLAHLLAAGRRRTAALSVLWPPSRCAGLLRLSFPADFGRFLSFWQLVDPLQPCEPHLRQYFWGDCPVDGIGDEAEVPEEEGIAYFGEFCGEGDEVEVEVEEF